MLRPVLGDRLLLFTEPPKKRSSRKLAFRLDPTPRTQLIAWPYTGTASTRSSKAANWDRPQRHLRALLKGAVAPVLAAPFIGSTKDSVCEDLRYLHPFFGLSRL